MVDRAIFIGYNGVVSQQFGIDTLSNNISNINTIGYRAQRPTFADLFSRLDRLPTATANPIQTGHGVDLQSIDTLFRQGSIKEGDIFSNLAIDGTGFFVLRDPSKPAVAQTFYTRAGNFSFDAGIAASGSGNPFTSGGQTVFLRDLPTYTTLPRLVDTGTGRVVQGYLADADGVILTSATDLTVDPAAKDPAKETTFYNLQGTLDSDPPIYNMTLMKDSTNSQLATFSGSYNNNKDRGLLTVSWNADGSGTWSFLKTGQTVPDTTNMASFSANTVKPNTSHSFIPGVVFRIFDETNLQAGTFTALVGPFKVSSNSTVINTVEGSYLGNRNDGTLTIKTTSSGGVSWSFVPKNKNFISESGSGTFATAASSDSTIIPGITMTKTAGTALTNGTLIFDTKHEDDAAGIVTPFFDDSSPTTQHTLITTFKQIQQNEYGYLTSAQTSEKFSGSTITTLSNGQKRITTYANIDPNQITVKTVSNNAELTMASSKITSDTANNISAASLRGAFWNQDVSGNIALSIAADGSGSWSFTPAGQLQPTASGTIAVGTIKANTTYGLPTSNEIIPGLIFTTGSAVAAGSVALESSIGSYNVYNNLITFAPSFSSKMTSLTEISADYKFASSTITRPVTSTETNAYFGNVTFDAKGQYLSTSTVPVMTLAPNSTFDTLIITPNFSSVQQVFGKSALDAISRDGNVDGVLTNIEFDEQGRLIGVFSNEKQKNLAQIVLGRFRNEGGLNRGGDTSFTETVASGTATVQSIDQMGPGIARVFSKKLEYSNSNLEDELTDLIFFQRAFQFSSRAIRLADELVQNAIAMKR